MRCNKENSDKQKMRKCIASKPALQEIFEEVFQVESN